MISSTLLRRRRRRNVGNAAEFKSLPSLNCVGKNEYLVNVNKVPDSKDLISQLPDDILISILGRMHTSCATRTSILSTRWRNLYKEVSNIDLNCSYLLRHIPVDCGSRFLSQKTSWPNLHKFVSKIEWGIGYVLGCHHANQIRHDPGLVVDSLDRFLSLRSGFKVHSVYLSCCLNNSVSVEQFIYALGRLGVEKLFLNFSCHDVEIPDDLCFSSRILSKMPSLKYLRLRICSLIPTLRTQCDSLQILQLDCIDVLPNSLEGILSNCPSLHTLSISFCKCPSKLSFRGPHLQLKSLEIMKCRKVKEIELHATNLVVFELTNCGVVNIIFDHVPQLQTVYLSIFEEDIMQYVCGKLAEDVPHLKSFSFSSRGDCFQGSDIRTGINRFSNLRRLDLTIIPITGKNDLLLLAPLLQSCSILHEFHLHTFLSEHNRPPQGKKQGILFHSELKKVEISGFVGTENDIEFALYILKSAINLEEMHITKCRKIYMGFRRWDAPEYEQTIWSEETRRTIVTRLQGQAVSRKAQLIVEHKAQDYEPTPMEEDFYDYVWSN